MQVLLVEDNPTVRQALASSLRRAGHDVFAVETVAEARVIAAGHSLDLIVSDFYLPDGNGVEFMHWLRERTSVPGIAISGDPEPGIRELCLSSGFATFLPKPILWTAIDEAIQRIFVNQEKAQC